MTEYTEQLEVTRTVYPVKDFVNWHAYGQINLRPSFQRLDVWKPKAKSFLIDTVVRGLPMPIVILRDASGISLTPKRDVVDGQQRLTTLLSFIMPETFEESKRFTINAAHSKELAGKLFTELPDSIKALILNYEISTHVLPSKVDDQEVLRIFSRLNSTGSQLNPQELRNAQFHGYFKTFVFDLSLSNLDYWKKWRLFHDDDFARMKEVEFTTELVVQILEGTTGTSARQLDAIYRQYDDDFMIAANVKARFETVFSSIDNGFGLRMTDTVYTRPTWFYALFGTVHEILFGSAIEQPINFHSMPKPRKLDAGIWGKLISVSDTIKKQDSLPVEIAAAITGRTTHLKTRKVRAKFISDQLK